MNEQILIADEMVCLARSRSQRLRSPLPSELGRMVVESYVLAADPELNWLIMDGEAVCQHDDLVSLLGVNDIVVNGTRLDVRVADSDGCVSIDRSLTGTSYLSAGSIVVALSGWQGGRAVGFVPASAWMAAAEAQTGSNYVTVARESVSGLDWHAVIAQGRQEALALCRLESEEIVSFICDRQSLTAARQREIVEALMASENARARLSQVFKLWSEGTLVRVLSAQAIWQGRVSRVAEALSCRYKRVSRERIEEIVADAGARYGGQPSCPQFRRQLVVSLVKADVESRLAGFNVSRVAVVVERVLSGMPVSEAVAQMVRSRVALDLASVIKKARSGMDEFRRATAEEIGAAFRDLALQPAYATHSSEGEAGIEAINDALVMLDAGALADELTAITGEIA